MIKSVLLVGLGGGVGSMCRYLTNLAVSKYLPSNFPLGTFAVNFLGCLLIGVLAGLFAKQQLSQELKLLFIAGFCGGYTTFSAFAAEGLGLFQTGHSFLSVIYLVGSVLVGILGVWLGLALVK